MYLIVLLTKYKRTYDQINQIEKQVKAIYHELVFFLRSKKVFCYIPENDSEQDFLGWNTSYGMEKISTETIMDRLDMFQSVFKKIDEFGWWDLKRNLADAGSKFTSTEFKEEC